MTDSNVVELKAPTQDALGDLLKVGARQLLAQAVEAPQCQATCRVPGSRILNLLGGGRSV